MTTTTITKRLTPSAILDIAQLDAGQAYGDLSAYRITLALHADGWHVDFDFDDPLMAGGGPHYIIDPTNGSILVKRYDQ
jgi:hypothetical protein